MTLPLSSALELSAGVELALALLLGLAFGATLERGGMAGARRLTAVFYFHDMAVVKVMFTAVVTAMAGLWLLAALGALELGEIYVEKTHLAAQAIGGLLFGAGFLVGGYCPGTAVAALATGRQDGAVFALGMLLGVYAYAEVGGAGLEAWYAAGAQGEQTLPALTGIGMGAWALAFAALLALAVWGLARLEARFAHWRPGS